MPARKALHPRTSQAARDRAKAQSWAKSELADRHKDEYRALYDFYCEALGLRTVRSTKVRPDAKEVA